MAELILLGVIVCLLLERAYSQHLARLRDQRLLNMIAANSTHELALLNKIDEQPVRQPVGSQERELIHPVGA